MRIAIKSLIFLFISSTFASNCNFFLDGNNDYTCELINLTPSDEILDFNSNHLEDFTSVDVKIVKNDHHLPNQMKKLTNQILKEFLNLRELYLNSLQIEVIENDAFGSCNELQVLSLNMNNLQDIKLENCEGLKNLYIEHNALENFEINSPNLEELSLTGNELTSINSEFNGLKKLKSLSLSLNKISVVNLNVLENLMTLKLSKNFLTNFENFYDGIKELSNLQHLDLSENYFDHVSFKSDFKSTNLKELILDNNEIISIKSMEGVPNLKILSMKANRIDEFPVLSDSAELVSLYLDTNEIRRLKYSIHSFDKLTNLSLTHNKIYEISKVFFKSFLSLQVLSLSSNDFKSLDSQAFNSLASLKSLDISNNQINDLPEGIFKNLQNLKKIDMKHNEMTIIHTHLFGNNDYMEEIIVSFNSINAIDPKFIDKFPNLKKFDASINPCVKSTINSISQIENCITNYENLLTTSTTAKITDDSTLAPNDKDSSNKQLILSIVVILGVALMLFALIFYIHDLVLLKEKKIGVKQGNVVKPDDKTLPNYERF